MPIERKNLIGFIIGTFLIAGVSGGFIGYFFPRIEQSPASGSFNVVIDGTFNANEGWQYSDWQFIEYLLTDVDNLDTHNFFYVHLTPTSLYILIDFISDITNDTTGEFIAVWIDTDNSLNEWIDDFDWNTSAGYPGHEMLCFIDMKPGTVDEISKSGIGSGRLQPSGCTDKLSVKKITGPPSETVMNVVEIYRRILNERIKKRTGIIPKIKKVSANSDNTMFVVTIDYTFCLIVRDMRGGSGHTNKGNVGQCDKSVFLIVNTKKRLFYQKCFHDVCRSKKTETWFF